MRVMNALLAFEKLIMRVVISFYYGAQCGMIHSAVAEPHSVDPLTTFHFCVYGYCNDDEICVHRQIGKLCDFLKILIMISAKRFQ